MRYLHAAYSWLRVAIFAAYYGTISIIGGMFSHDISHWAMLQWCRKLVAIFHIRHRWINGERIKEAPQCIFVANHLSSIDILVLGSYIERDYRWLAKSVLFKVPFSGWHLTLSGHIPVYRGKHKHKNKDLPKRIHKVVEEGACLLFFPEGTRNTTKELLPFRIGAFRAAIDESLPILPIVLRDTDKIMRKNAIDRSNDLSIECTVTVLDLIQPPKNFDDPAEAAAKLRDQVYTAMKEEYSKPQSS